jgi:PPE-repeat protein
MDFAFLPPEINSGRIYTGPGSGPMLAAAAAWDGLATELHSAATSYELVISELTSGPWLGAGSAAMRTAAERYVAWMRSTATQAELTATQAKAAAAAFEVTFAAMVPPPVIAANRALLQALVATNLFGQNTPAIAATEALYAEMWAQDATAMYGYSGASTAASTLAPFTPSPQTTTGAAAATSAEVSAAAVDDPLGTIADIIDIVLFLPGVAQAGLTPLNTTSIFTDLSFDEDEIHFEGLESTEQDILNTLRINGFRLPEGAGEALMSRPVIAPGPAEVPVVTAGLGRAASVGGMSVPQGWTVAAPEIRLAALTLPTAGLGAAPEAFAASPANLLGEMTLANMAGNAISGTRAPGRRPERIASVACARPGSTTSTSASGHKTAIAADVHEFAEALVKLGDLRDSGLLTDEEFSKEKERLLAR